MRARYRRLSLALAAHRRSLPPLPAVPQTPKPPLATTCIAFSKDRPMQLDAMLRSFARFAPYAARISVIVRATDPAFARGYRIVADEHAVDLVTQSEDLRRDVLELLDGADDHTLFQVDDDVYFRAPPAVPELPDGFCAFTLRLGRNTTLCYPLSCSQPLPEMETNGPFVAWNWARAQYDFAYPLSLDGHLLRTAALRRLVARARFSDPTGLEQELHEQRARLPHALIGFADSCMVSIPANRVSENVVNRSGDRPEWSARALNDRFLAGERIDLDAMDFSAVGAAHQEIPFAFMRP